MANDMNVVVLVGRLTRDPDYRTTSNGTTVCRFSVAVNRRRKSGETWVDEVNYFDITYWRPPEGVKAYLTKGRQVCIDGELRQDRWEQDGQSRSKVDIVVNNLQLLSATGGGASGGNAYGGASGAQGGYGGGAPAQSSNAGNGYQGRTYGNPGYGAGAQGGYGAASGSQAPGSGAVRETAAPDDYEMVGGPETFDDIPF